MTNITSVFLFSIRLPVNRMQIKGNRRATNNFFCYLCTM